MASKANAGNRYYSGPQSDHFDGRVFFNPNGTPPRGPGDLLRWQFGGGRAVWPATFPSPHEPARPDERVDGKNLRVTMVGHATLLVQVAGLNILTDPVWSDRASPVSFAGPKRVNAPGIAFADLPPIDLILLSHNHYDHMDIATLRRLKADHDPLVVTPLGNDAIVGADIPDMRMTAHDWGEAVEIADGVTVHVEPVHHWSARGMGDRRMALWAGFVVETPAGRIYHVGDTGFHAGVNYRAAAEKHGSFRLAILPFGAYEPRWFMEAQHQNPDEAVAGMMLCNAAFAAGHHWATFQLTNEGIEEPRELLLAALDREKVPRDRFRPMLPGEVWDVPEA
ncbi:MAG: MBL fold metallo-hydrolase [Rhizobiaceae bacterium]|nr:MBL fold metallo-hydrolase [Rhizobiaceae bacterium]MCV0404635.1 MBL fold metallo-hydrolase [Rhizobiaceae bacterium]